MLKKKKTVHARYLLCWFFFVEMQSEPEMKKTLAMVSEIIRGIDQLIVAHYFGTYLIGPIVTPLSSEDLRTLYA